MPPLPDVDSMDTFGGERVNAFPKEDPTTDVGSEDLNPLFADVAMMTHTALRAWVIWQGITYTSGTMSIVPTSHDAVWGSGDAIRPTVQQSAAGIWLITWGANQDDLLNVSHPVNIRMPQPPVVYGADGLRAKVISWTANTITVNSTSAGALNALNGTLMGVGFI